MACIFFSTRPPFRCQTIYNDPVQHCRHAALSTSLAQRFSGPGTAACQATYSMHSVLHCVPPKQTAGHAPRSIAMVERSHWSDSTADVRAWLDALPLGGGGGGGDTAFAEALADAQFLLQQADAHFAVPDQSSGGGGSGGVNGSANGSANGGVGDDGGGGGSGGGICLQVLVVVRSDPHRLAIPWPSPEDANPKVCSRLCSPSPTAAAVRVPAAGRCVAACCLQLHQCQHRLVVFCPPAQVIGCLVLNPLKTTGCRRRCRAERHTRTCWRPCSGGASG